MTHTVTVTTRVEDEGTEDERRRVDRIVFTCDAGPDADCRRYPDCDCETFVYVNDRNEDTSGHERVPGRSCLLADWFSAEGASYVGDDYDDMRDDGVPAIDRSGPIDVSWHEWPEWTFRETPDHMVGGE